MYKEVIYYLRDNLVIFGKPEHDDSIDDTLIKVVGCLTTRNDFNINTENLQVSVYYINITHVIFYEFVK